MRMEDVNARKAYIQNVRKSFDSPNRRYEFEKEADTKGEAQEGSSFFKLRLFAAAFLFAAYIFCDRTNTEIYHVSTKEVMETFAGDFDYGNVKEELQQVFHVIQEQTKPDELP